MTFSSRYFYVYVFAAFSIGFALMVGLHTEAATRGVERLARDGQLIVTDARRVARKVSREFDQSPRAVVRLFVDTLYLPDLLFRQVRKELERVNRQI